MMNQLVRILNEFLEPFECSAKYDKEEGFGYYYRKSLITFNLEVNSISNDTFMDNFHKLAPDIEADIFLASFFHELGHHMTLDTVSDEEYKESREEIDRLNWLTLFARNCEDQEAIDRQYYNVPLEAMATNWAIDYMRNHTKEVAEFWAKAQMAIMNYYKQEGLI